MLWPDDVTDEQLALAAASHEEHDSDNERSRQDVLDDAMFGKFLTRHTYMTCTPPQRAWVILTPK